MPEPTQLPVQLINQGVTSGHFGGLAQPCLRIQLAISPVVKNGNQILKRLESLLDAHLVPMPAGKSPDFAAELEHKPWLPLFRPQVWPVVEMLNQWFVRLQETAGMPVSQGTRCELLGPNRDKVTTFVALLVPSLNPVALQTAMPWVIDQLNRCLSGEPLAVGELDGQLALLERAAPRGINNRQLLSAAFALNVPCIPLPNGVFQYGWGSRARWMDSTFTDASSTISAKLSRSKVAAQQLLKRAGFPVPEQVSVQSLDQLKQAASKMGYPVVVKPADQDGGVGVSAGLETEQAVLLAYERALKHSKSIILEKHIPGNDYRLGIVHGKLGWATFREPAGVHGDGASTLENLIAVTNQDPRRSTKKWANMKPLVLDEIAQELLAEQNVQKDTVVEQGRFVRLRRASNISAGGTPINVMERVHPDNVALAEQVARLFKLDFAGIDLITPDVTRSWKEVGGGICEVNGAPQFSVAGPQAPYLAISGLFEGDGRIPTVVVLAEQPCANLMTNLQARLADANLNLGFSHADGLWVNGGYLKFSRDSAFKDGQALLINPTVDAAVIVTDGKEWLRTGMPFDRFDELVTTQSSDAKVLAALKPQCAQVIDIQTSELDAPQLAADLAQAIIRFDALHKATQLTLPEPYQKYTA